MTVKKHLRAQEVALHNRLPCVYLVDSGGAFLPHAGRGLPRPRALRPDLLQPGDDVRARASRRSPRSWAPAPPAAPTCPAMSDETVIVREQGTIFLGGPPLVKAATGEEVTAEELGGGDVHARTSGVVDHLAEDDDHALEILRAIVATLPPPPRAAVGARAAAPAGARTPTACSTSSRSTRARPTTCARCCARIVDGSRAARVQGALRHDARVRLRPHRRPPGRRSSPTTGSSSASPR